jgi:hypothetical protein
MRNLALFALLLLSICACASASAKVADGRYVDRQSRIEIVVNGNELEIHFPSGDSAVDQPTIQRYQYSLKKNGILRIVALSSDQFLREIGWHDWHWTGTRIERTSHRDQSKTVFEPVTSQQ